MKLENLIGNKKTGKILFEAGILIMVINLLSSVGIWQSIFHGWKVSSGGELFSQAFIQSGGNYVITYLNQESIYISFLSVLFSFLGNKEELVLIINLILQFFGILFFYLGSRKLFRFLFPLAIAVISGILSSCFYPVTADSPMHIIWFLSGLVFWMITKGFSDISGLFLKHILLGILLGIFCYIDLAGFFLLVTCILFTLITKEFTLKEKGMQFSCFFLCSILGCFCMFYLWNNFLFDAVVFQQWLNDRIKPLKLETGLNQYLSISIVLIVCVVFYAIKCSRKVAAPMTEATVSASVPIEETAVQNKNIAEDQIQKSGFCVQEEPKAEIKKTIKFIENPLPLPKKHVKKEMNYAFEPTKEQMHYDLNNYSVDDDYDLKDIS